MVRAARVCAAHKGSSFSPDHLTCPITTLQGGLRPHFRDEERSSDGFEELAQGCTKPGFAAQLPVSDQLQAGRWALRSEGKGSAQCPCAVIREWAARLTPGPRCSSCRTEPPVPRRRRPVGSTHQSSSHASGLVPPLHPAFQPWGLGGRRRPTMDSSCNENALATRGHLLTAEMGKSERWPPSDTLL